MFALLPLLSLLVGAYAQDAATDLAVVQARFEGKLTNRDACSVQADSLSRPAGPPVPSLFQPRRSA